VIGCFGSALPKPPVVAPTSALQQRGQETRSCPTNTAWGRRIAAFSRAISGGDASARKRASAWPPYNSWQELTLLPNKGSRLRRLWSFAYWSHGGRGFMELPDVFCLSLALTALGETQ